MALVVLPELTMTNHCRFADPRTDRIRALNDSFRTSLSGGSVMVTRAVAALGAEAQREILAALRRYDEFNADNDPYGEHDFGRMTVQGHEILRLHRHNATPETRDKAPHRAPPHPASQNNPARSVQTSKAARVLAKINPNDNDVHRPVPFSLKTIAILTDPGERGGAIP
jgi:hypothetical protein